jgi:hypothetical protein
MGLAQINHEFPSPAGRFLLLTTKVINLTLLSKDYPIFFLDAANLEINQTNLFPLLFRGVLILRELLLLFFDRHNTPFDFFLREFK